MPRNLKEDWKKIGMKEATVKALSSEVEEEIVFADENARIAWEIGQAVDRIMESLPPEGTSLNTETISFDSENLSRGTYAVFFAGTVIATDRKGVLAVSERSLYVLKQLGISYQVV